MSGLPFCATLIPFGGAHVTCRLPPGHSEDHEPSQYLPLPPAAKEAIILAFANFRPGLPEAR